MQGDSVLGRWRVERGGDGTGAPSRAAGRKYVPNPRHDVRAARVARDQQGFAYRADRFLPDESGLVVGKPAHALFAYGAAPRIGSLDIDLPTLRDDAVDFTRGLRRYPARGQVPGHGFRFALDRIAPAPAALPGHGEDVSVGHFHQPRLGPEQLPPAIRLGTPVLDGAAPERLSNRGAGPAAPESHGIRHFGTVGHDQRFRASDAAQRQRDFGAQAAAELARAGRVGCKPAVKIEKRRYLFVALDIGDRRYGRRDRSAGVDAVLGSPRSGARSQRIHQVQPERLAKLVDAAEVEGRHAAIADRLGPMAVLGRGREQPVQREHGGIGYDPDGLHRCRAHGGGKLRGADQAVGRDDLRRFQDALVPLDVPAERGQDAAAGAAHESGAGRVDETRRLFARAAVIERHPVAALGELHVHFVQHVVVPVVLEKIAGVELAVGEFTQARAGACFGRFDHALHGLRNHVGAIPGNKVGDAVARHVEGGDEGADVQPQCVGKARGGGDHFEHVLAQLAAVNELDAGNPDAFLIDVFRSRTPTGEVHAADIGLVGLDARPGDDPVGRVDGADHLHVVLVQRADVGIVADEHVPITHLQMGLGVDVADHRAGHGRLERHLESHRYDRPVGQEQTGEEVRCLGHGRRARYALQGDAHLLGDGDQAVANHLEGHRADAEFAVHACLRTCKLPRPSAVARAPGGTTTLCPGNSMMAGPATLAPSAGNVVR